MTTENTEAIVPTQEPKTYREMCEAIVEAGILRKRDGSAPTWLEVFEYSPTGELFMVFGWYEMAKSLLEARAVVARMRDECGMERIKWENPSA
jgi:hypothetical protein